MVTNKTRLLSALMAILMLVSLFTGFVLPVTAAEDYAMPTAPENLIAYKDRTTATDVVGDNGLINYKITDVEDWTKLAMDTNAYLDGEEPGTFDTQVRRTFAGWAFWFTDDLDFSKYSGTYNGGNGVANFITRQLFLNVYTHSTSFATGFQGHIYGQGHKITNLKLDITNQITNGNYKQMGLIAGGYNAVIRDLTIDSSCSFRYSVGGSTYEWQTGAFMGLGKNVTFINCHNEASVEINDLVTDKEAGTITSASTNSTSSFGRQTGALTMIDCSNAGAITSNDESRASGLAEWLTTGEATIYNSYNVGVLTTNSTLSYDYTGAISTSSKDAAGFTGDIKNCYGVGDSFACGSRSFADLAAYGTELPIDAVATGELAYLLNANYMDNDYGHIYYTVKDGKVVQGAKNKQTVKVQFDCAGEEISAAYLNIGDSLTINSHDYNLFGVTGYTTTDPAATITGSTITVNDIPATDLTVKVDVATTGVDYSAFIDAVQAYDGKNMAYYVDGEGNKLSTTYEEILNGIDGYNQDQVDAAVTKLNSFAFNPDQIVLLSEYETYKDMTHNFEIKTAEDFVVVGGMVSKFTVDDTLYITQDIDMGGSSAKKTSQITKLKASLVGMKDGVEGKAVTISNIYVNTNWLGNYYGANLENIVFKNCTACDVSNPGSIIIGDVYGTYEHTFKNITMIGCTATKVAQSNTMGLLVGRNYQGTKFTYKDIRIEGCSMSDVSGRAGGNVNIAFVVGNAYKAAPTIMENVYLKGNSFYSDYIDTANGMVVGEISSTGSEFRNIAVLDTEVVYNDVASTTLDDYAPVDLLSVIGLFKAADSEMTVDNVIYAGTTVAKKEGSTSAHNVEAVSIVGTNVDTSNEIVNISNVYTDVAYGCKTMDANTVNSVNVNVNAGEAITSGVAAYELNKVVEQKWAMDGTTPIFDTDKTEETHKVTFTMNIEGEEPQTFVEYTNKDGVVDVTERFKGMAEWSLTDWTAPITTDLEVTGTHVHTYAYEQQVIEQETCGKDGTLLKICSCGLEKTDPIPATGDHDYEEAILQPPSVEEEGKKSFTCSVCEDYYTEAIPVLPGLEISVDASEANDPIVNADVKLLNYGAKEVTLKVEYNYINMTLAEEDITSTLFTVEAFSAENGVAEIKLVADADVGADEVVATLNFKLKEKAYNGEYVFNATAEGINLAGDPVAYEPAEEKTVDVTWCKDKIKGDLNIDETVDLRDAILLMRYIEGDLPEEYQTIVTDEMADLTEHGNVAGVNVNVDDVIHLLRYLNGWIDTL